MEISKSFLEKAKAAHSSIQAWRIFFYRQAKAKRVYHHQTNLTIIAKDIFIGKKYTEKRTKDKEKEKKYIKK